MITCSAAESPLSLIERDGFAIIERLLSADRIASAVSAIEHATGSSAVRRRRGSTFAIRNLLAEAPELQSVVADRTVQDVITSVLGANSTLVRAILFDKTPEANWAVPWHQDTTIAVRERIEVEGFGPWSMKAGVVHVQPSVEVLGRMATLRIHLDDCNETNGALMVLPGSHRHGLLNEAEIAERRAKTQAQTCAVSRGGGVIMRPLLLHASSPAKSPAHRRVVHLEFAAGKLPGGLRWNVADE